MNIRRARYAVGLVFLLLGSMIGTWASRIPDIKMTLAVDDSGFGLVLLMMASGAVTGIVFSGRLIDLFGAARVTKVAATATLILFPVLPLATSVLALLGPIFAVGFAFGTVDVSMNGWGADVEKALKRPVMSSYHGLFSLGAGLGAGAGAAALWLELSVLTHFFAWLAVFLVPLIIVLRVNWSWNPAPKSAEKPPLIGVPRGPLFFVGLLALIAALGEGAVTDWAALYQIQELGIDSSQAAIGFSVFSVAMVIMRLVGDQIIARFGPVPVSRISGLAAFAGTLLLVWGDGLWMVWTGCAIMGLGNALIFPLAMSRAAADPVMSSGAALAAVATLGYGAFLLGPPILGFIGDAVSLRAAFSLVAVLALLIAVLARHLRATAPAS